METDKCNARKSNTDPLPWINETPPAALWNQQELEKARQHIWFERTSGPGADDWDEDEEDLTEKDTIVSPAIQLVQPLPKKYESHFTGMSKNAIGLCRSGIHHHANTYNGTLPEEVRTSLKKYNDVKVDLAYIYGKDFHDEIPLSLMMYGDKTVRIMYDSTINSNDTVICAHESVDISSTL